MTLKSGLLTTLSIKELAASALAKDVGYLKCKHFAISQIDKRNKSFQFVKYS
ncbi:hypothetical protein [Oligella sp. MSHR50489EDL]|uniref:hypothetical protein n=1 Tax=Oligella sp. MSHR50489EDL TaxID=3139409 RepID=UPI003D815ECD